jgi:hypothetical protein
MNYLEQYNNEQGMKRGSATVTQTSVTS